MALPGGGAHHALSHFHHPQQQQQQQQRLSQRPQQQSTSTSSSTGHVSYLTALSNASLSRSPTPSSLPLFGTGVGGGNGHGHHDMYGPGSGISNSPTPVSGSEESYYPRDHHHHQQQQSYHQPQPSSHQQQQHHHQQLYSGYQPAPMAPHRKESVVVILDQHGLNKFRNNKQHFAAPTSAPSIRVPEMDSFAGLGLKKSVVQDVVEEEDEDEGESDTEDEERRRYVKRQRHRSIVEADRTHEIRFEDSSSASTSVSSSPRSGGAVDEHNQSHHHHGHLAVDVPMIVDDDSRGRFIDSTGHSNERDGDAAKVLEEMKMYTSGMRDSLTVKRLGIHGGRPRANSYDKYHHVLPHKPASSPQPPPMSPHLGAGRLGLSRVGTPFQRMASPFVRATANGEGTMSGYLEIVETIAPPRTDNGFAFFTEWLLMLVNGHQNNMPIHIKPATGIMSRDSVKNLTILWHPASGHPIKNLGTIPTIHVSDPNDKSLLHIAIRHRLPLDIIRTLLDLGATEDIARKDNKDINCLHEALQLSPPTNTPTNRTQWTEAYLLPLVDMLLESTGSQHPHPLVNEPMAWSCDSPLHIALKHQHALPVIDRLLAHGARAAGVRDVFGAAPLHIVCQHLLPPTTGGSPSQAHASPASRSGATTPTRPPVHDVPPQAKSPIVELLLASGAGVDVDIATADGHTPLHYAIKALSYVPPTVEALRDVARVVEMLVNEGQADVSVRNGEGDAALAMASNALVARAGDEAEREVVGGVVRLLCKRDREGWLRRQEEGMQ